MPHRTLRHAIDDLAAAGRLVQIDAEIDPHLEAAAIHRRVFAAGGPALLFTRVKGCSFPMVSNLFGTMDRVRHIFRHTLDAVRRLIELRVDPLAIARQPLRHAGAPFTALHMLPRYVRRAPVLAHPTTIAQLPRLKCWPGDGGPFVTLPLVYTEDPDRPGKRHSNLGMYRVQLAGNQYAPNREVGLHYQIHRGIGVHHAAAIRRGQPLRAHILVGGTPAMTVAAVMPLPEGMSELGFAGALAGHRIALHAASGGLPVYAEADFCITGTIDPHRLLPEGPFGDHLGYYSLQHDFPVLRVERVTHRTGAVWPFTVVGRPPQEDTMFGQLIHELTGAVIPTVVTGVKAVHAVDAAGVHPLLLAIGSERYTPYAPSAGENLATGRSASPAPRRPAELLTQANAILGQGQMSLAKYLMIVDGDDDPGLSIHDVAAFFRHVLQRVDWRRDLHFQTCTTMDTLDYTGGRLNEGSKLVVAAVGAPRRELPVELAGDLRLPDGFRNPHVALPGILAVDGPPADSPAGTDRANEPAADGSQSMQRFCHAFASADKINAWPLIVVVDDAGFVADSLSNFLWVTFTRSNPAVDVYGIESFTTHKHWGAHGSLVIDARCKPHHAPPLEEDPAVMRRVEALGLRGGPLAGIL